MTKTELVDKVAAKTGFTKKDSTKVVDAVFESIQEALAAGLKVQLVGFGSFEVRRRAARAGRDPRTGKTIRIGARTVPVFKAGKTLKDAVST